MAELNASKLKKIARIIADRASQEEAEIRTLSGRQRTSDDKAIAKLLEKHIDGLAALKPDFDALMTRNEAKAESQIKKLRAEALKIARSRKPALDRMIAQRVKSFEALTHPVVEVPSAERYFVNTPIEIYSTQIDLDSLSNEPSNSWAKFMLDFRKNAGPSVIFRFVWENSTDKYVLINVDGYVILHGFCDLWSDGGVFAGYRMSSLTMAPTLELYDYTTEPFPPLTQAVNIPFAVHVQTDSGGMFDDADSETELVFRGYDLRKDLVIVPPSTAVGLHASVQMSVGTGDGEARVRADFISDSFGVTVPGVLITKLS
jgi:hypothetical protein